MNRVFVFGIRSARSDAWPEAVEKQTVLLVLVVQCEILSLGSNSSTDTSTCCHVMGAWALVLVLVASRRWILQRA